MWYNVCLHTVPQCIDGVQWACSFSWPFASSAWYSRYVSFFNLYVRWVCALYLAHVSQVLEAVRVGAVGDYTVRLKYSTSSNATLQLLAAVTLQSRKVDQILQQVAVLNDSIQHVISSAQGRQERAPQQQDPCTRSRVSRQVN